MRADPRFLNQRKHFWANVRSISEAAGYTERGAKTVKVHSIAAMKRALEEMGLGSDHIGTPSAPTELGASLAAYFQYRADALNNFVEPRLMDIEAAKQLFEEVKNAYKQRCPLPLNKQKGDKAGYAYFTGVINMLVEQNVNGLPVEYDPRRLTTITLNNAPLRTLSRRLDGAFPGPLDPISIWEVKEYYHTKTFGSRIADGVYETQLDGLELHELESEENVSIEHVLFVDSHFTWWECGRSYLCRIIDMLHMGLVDEVVFGSEVVEAVPRLVRGWVETYKLRGDTAVQPALALEA